MGLKPVQMPRDAETDTPLKPGLEYFIQPSDGGGPTLLGIFKRAVCRCESAELHGGRGCTHPVLEWTLGDEEIALMYVDGMSFNPTDESAKRLAERATLRAAADRAGIVADDLRGIIAEMSEKVDLLAIRLVEQVKRVDALEEDRDRLKSSF